MIRIATMEDAPAIVELVRQSWAESQLGDIEDDPEIVQRTVAAAVQSPGIYFRVLDLDGEIQGAIAGTLVPSMAFRGDVATDIINYVTPKYRGKGIALLKGFLQWAFGFDSVHYVALSISYGGEAGKRTEEFYQSLKYERLGATFIVRRKA